MHLLFLITVVLIQPAAAPADPLAETIIRSGCYANHKPDPAVVRELLRIESAAGFTGPARGLLVAAACNESGFNAHALGDWKDVVTGKRCRNNTPGCVPQSFGMLQFQAWAKRKIRPWATTKGDPRFDWRAAATYWAKHVKSQMSRVRKECRYPDLLNTWRAAHRTAIVKPKCGRWRHSVRLNREICVKWIARCHNTRSRYKSKHWEIATQWQAMAERKFPRPVVQAAP